MSVETRSARRWLTQREAADYLGVTDRTIRKYIARGLLVGYRIGEVHTIRVDRLELEALLKPIPSAAVGDAVV